jgi:dihydrofolate synthase/folylpolyglutamate synthase
MRADIPENLLPTPMPRFQTLTQWLQWQETLHPRKIDLGLDRVASVGGRMEVLHPADTVITVGGTNGKGSCVAMLEAILLAAGYRVGSYTSPHLLRYNERIRINGRDVDDDSLCAAFQTVDDARGEITLSYFEFGTLAALRLFCDASLDVALLEVGLGGRLDAVNIVDPDVAMVTSIGIDHVQWLGDNRESIAREKAGIFRNGRPAIGCESSPPASLVQAAREAGAPWYGLGERYDYVPRRDSWDWNGPSARYAGLPLPALRGPHQLANASGVLMALELLQERLPVSVAAIRNGLQGVALPGRCQFMPGVVELILDVSHNPHGASRLAEVLGLFACTGRTHLVLGMLDDKDVGGFVAALSAAVDHWYPAGLDNPRGLSADELYRRMQGLLPLDRIHPCADVPAACRKAGENAMAGDRIVVCGSFFTVAAAMAGKV